MFATHVFSKGATVLRETPLVCLPRDPDALRASHPDSLLQACTTDGVLQRSRGPVAGRACVSAACHVSSYPLLAYRLALNSLYRTQARSIRKLRLSLSLSLSLRRSGSVSGYWEQVSG